MFVQSEGLGEQGRRPRQRVKFRLLGQEGVGTCCLVTIHVIKLVQLVAPHIALCDNGEISGAEPEQATLLLARFASSNIRQLHGGIIQVTTCVCMQHVVTCQRPMWALGVCIRDDAWQRVVCQRSSHVDRTWKPISIG